MRNHKIIKFKEFKKVCKHSFNTKCMINDLDCCASFCRLWRKLTRVEDGRKNKI